MTTESLAGRPTHGRLIVIGSGIAGLYSALLAAEAGAEVVLLTKGSQTATPTTPKAGFPLCWKNPLQVTPWLPT